MSYDYEIWLNVMKKKIQSRKQNLNRPYWETDGRNATQWNRMKGQTADTKYTHIFSKPNKWRTEIIQ